MANDWFCEIAGRELGPLTPQQLKTMAVKGQILPNDCVRQGAAGKWVPAGQLKGLFQSRQDAVQTTTGRQPAAATKPPHPSSPKKANPLPPAMPRVARPIVLPKVQSAQQPPDVPQPDSTPEFPDVTGSYAPPAYGGKNIAARAHAKRKQKQKQLLASSLAIVVVGLAIAGILLYGNTPKQADEKSNVLEAGDGATSGKSIKTAKDDGGKSKKPTKDEVAQSKKPTKDEIAKSKKPTKDENAKLKKPVKDDGGKVKPTDKPENAKQKPADDPKKADAAQPANNAEKPPEKPADKADDGKWVDASMSPAVVNNIPVHILSVIQQPGKAGAGELLIVMLKVENPSRISKMDFAGWSREAAKAGVIMTDDQGKSYPAQSIDITTFLAKPLPATIKPCESAKDVLAFEAPGPKVKFLLLELSAVAFGKIGTANLKIPVKMITGAAAAVESAPAKPPTIAEPTTPPPPKEPTTPPPQKEKAAPRDGTPESDFGIDPNEAPKD